MSKKHNKGTDSGSGYQPGGLSLAAEHQIIKHDLLRVVILNLFYLAAMVTLYVINQRSGAVDNWFARLLHF